MKKNNLLYTLLFALILLINSIYIINEAEQAIVTEFGRPVKSVGAAGIKFKIPFIQKVLRFDKRVLEWDGAANEIPTKDDKYIFIDAYARWKISDPLKFYKSARNERNAQTRIDDVIDGIIRDEISNRQMEEIIRSTDRKMETYDEQDKKQSSSDSKEVIPGARLNILNTILNNVSLKLGELDMGIEVLDVQIKRMNYNPQVQSKLFNRMISEQNMIAEKYRAQGQGKKQEILGLQIQEEKTILSDAYKESQKIKGRADAKATKIYAESYDRDRAFYEFIKSMDAYKNTLDSTTKLILSTDSKFFKYLE